jgi:hypothetical protein
MEGQSHFEYQSTCVTSVLVSALVPFDLSTGIVSQCQVITSIPLVEKKHQAFSLPMKWW